MSRVYPFKRVEKVLASLVLAAIPIGFIPVRADRTDGTWRVCIEIGLIPSWEWCWNIGKEKQPIAPCPLPPQCDPSTQSCPQ